MEFDCDVQEVRARAEVTEKPRCASCSGEMVLVCYQYHCLNEECPTGVREKRVYERLFGK